MPSPQLPGVMDLLYSESRIRYPMVRRAWLEKARRGARRAWARRLRPRQLGQGHRAGGRRAGTGARERWPAGRVRRVLRLEEPGQDPQLPDPAAAHAEPHRQLYQQRGRLFHRRRPGHPALRVRLDRVYEQCTTWKNLAENCELMVLWGCNPSEQLADLWQIADHGAWPGIELVKAGVKVLSIDPCSPRPAKPLNGEWLAPRPHTDVAMMLGIAHTLYVEGLHDQKFLDRYTTGFDKFLPYLLGKSDGTPKSADWAAQICGLPADTLRELARRFRQAPHHAGPGYSTQRQQHGEQIHWMLITLASMLGQIGLRRAAATGSATTTRRAAPRPAPRRSSRRSTMPRDRSRKGRPGWRAAARCRSRSRAWSRPCSTPARPCSSAAMTSSCRCSAGLLGGRQSLLPPAGPQRDAARLARAGHLHRPDVQWTATARHADIVLPATTSYERNDIEQVGDYAISHIVPMKKIVEPLFEARNDFDIFADIAAKLGKGYEFTQGRDEMDWIPGSIGPPRSSPSAKGMEMPVFDVFWKSNKPLAFPLSDAQADFVRHADFAPTRCSTPWVPPRAGSSCISRAIERYQYADCRPMPAGSSRSSAPRRADHQISAASLPPITRRCACIRSCAAPSIASYAIAGREPCVMHPDDARARGLSDGDVVRVFNDRPDPRGPEDQRRHPQGVVRINEGGWFDPLNPGEIGSLCRYGDVNNLMSGLGTSRLAQGNCGTPAPPRSNASPASCRR